MCLDCLQTSPGSKCIPCFLFFGDKRNWSREPCTHQLHPSCALEKGAVELELEPVAMLRLGRGCAAMPRACGSGSHFPAKLCGMEEPMNWAAPFVACQGWCFGVHMDFNGFEA